MNGKGNLGPGKVIHTDSVDRGLTLEEIQKYNSQTVGLTPIAAHDKPQPKDTIREMLRDTQSFINVSGEQINSIRTTLGLSSVEYPKYNEEVSAEDIGTKVFEIRQDMQTINKLLDEVISIL